MLNISNKKWIEEYEKRQTNVLTLNSVFTLVGDAALLLLDMSFLRSADSSASKSDVSVSLSLGVRLEPDSPGKV